MSQTSSTTGFFTLTLTIDENSEAGRNIETLVYLRGMSPEAAALELLATDQIYQSPIKAAVHESMLGVHQAGLLPESKMQEFNQMCLRPEFFNPTETEVR